MNRRFGPNRGGYSFDIHAIRDNTNRAILDSNGIPIQDSKSPIKSSLERHNGRYYNKQVSTGNNKRLIICLPGGGGTGTSIRISLNLPYALLNGSVVISPSMPYNPILGVTTWNAGPFFEYPGVPNDIDWLYGLIEKTIQEESIDVDRIYIMGVSNGGMMSDYFASESYRQDFLYKIAKVLSIVGTVTFDVDTLGYHHIGDMLTINTINDTVVPVEGTAYYRSQAASQAIYIPVVNSYEIILCPGKHGASFAKAGMLNLPEPIIFNEKLIEYFT